MARKPILSVVYALFFTFALFLNNGYAQQNTADFDAFHADFLPEIPLDSLPETTDQDTTFSINGIIQEQAAAYSDYQPPSEDTLNPTIRYMASGMVARYARPSNCSLKKSVYGFHPYWMSDEYFLEYDYSLLTDFCYFGMELNPTTGGYKTLRNWQTTNAIALAQQAGCRIELCVANFGGWANTKFLNSPNAQKNFVNVLIKALDMRNADGVNIDFENVYRRDSPKLTRFISYLRSELNQKRPNTRITMTIPPLDPYKVYNVNDLSQYTDALIIMAYDYHTANSKQAGPVAPLNGYYSLKNTINNYLQTGVNPNKFIMAVPYYGREWKTKTVSVPATAIASAKTVTYANVVAQYKQYKPRWHTQSASPYIVRIGKDGEISQCWFESKGSLAQKYDLALEKNLGGVGIWALGYDDGCSELWNLLEEKFVQCGAGNDWRQKNIYRQLVEDYFK